MKNKEILTALRCLKVETGSLVCMDCGREHNCGIHGCRIAREAAELIEKLTDRCARYVEEIAVLQEREKWVPVTERLPEIGKRVIVKDDIFCGEAYLSISGDWYRYNGTSWADITDSPVTHWMPLPEV